MRYLVACLLIVGCAQKRPVLETRDVPPTLPAPASTASLSLGYSIVKTLHDPLWLRDPAILGHCSASLQDDTNLEIPCQNVVVTAVDDKGVEKGRAAVESGKFRLSVEKGKQYYVRVIAPQYQIADANRIGPVKAGETIDLRLSRK